MPTQSFVPYICLWKSRKKTSLCVCGMAPWRQMSSPVLMVDLSHYTISPFIMLAICTPWCSKPCKHAAPTYGEGPVYKRRKKVCCKIISRPISGWIPICWCAKNQWLIVVYHPINWVQARKKSSHTDRCSCLQRSIWTRARTVLHVHNGRCETTFCGLFLF